MKFRILPPPSGSSKSHVALVPLLSKLLQCSSDKHPPSHLGHVQSEGTPTPQHLGLVSVAPQCALTLWTVVMRVFYLSGTGFLGQSLWVG